MFWAKHVCNRDTANLFGYLFPEDFLSKLIVAPFVVEQWQKKYQFYQCVTRCVKPPRSSCYKPERNHTCNCKQTLVKTPWSRDTAFYKHRNHCICNRSTCEHIASATAAAVRLTRMTTKLITGWKFVGEQTQLCAKGVVRNMATVASIYLYN